jgi:uncharacterized membrane protein
MTDLTRIAMPKLIVTYLASMVWMFILDLIWLSQLAQPMYQQGIGHLMAKQANLLYAGIFYTVFVFGLIWYAIRPYRQQAGVKPSILAGAMYGFFIYASYEFTNLALLRDWPLGMSLIDIGWGVLLSGATAGFAKTVLAILDKR